MSHFASKFSLTSFFSLQNCAYGIEAWDVHVCWNMEDISSTVVYYSSISENSRSIFSLRRENVAEQKKKIKILIIQYFELLILGR